MKLSFKFKPSFTVEQLSIIEELSYHTTKLYNIINYDLRENGFKSYVDIENDYKSNWHCDFLHSHTRQHCFKMIEQNWKSYFASIKDYKENPNKYKGLPKPPKFKNMENKRNEIVFTNLAIRFKENTLMLSLSKASSVKSFDILMTYNALYNLLTQVFKPIPPCFCFLFIVLQNRN